MYGAEFLARAPIELATKDDEKPDMQFVEGGYLFLASETGTHILKQNHQTQR